MRVRFPLYGQFLLLFGINLVVLLAGLTLFLHLHFGLGIDTLLSGWARNRMFGTVRVLAGELREVPPEQWPAVLARYDEAFGVHFLLVDPQGRLMAGRADLPIPVPVAQRVEEVSRRNKPVEGRRETREEPRRWEPVSFIRTETAPRYWAVLRVPFVPRGKHDRSPTLLVASPKIGGGGLFFDPVPWLLAIGGSLLVSALIWLPYVRGITRTLAGMSAAAGNIAEGQFHGVPDVRRPDELGVLGGSIRSMAGRLEYFVSEQRRFLGAIAHELASPLARARLALGVAEEKAAGPDRPPLRDVEEELAVLSGLVNELLSFSKASLQSGALARAEVTLRDLVGEVIAREARHGAVENAIPPGLKVLANREMLDRAIANLLRNAVRYAGIDGPIRCEAETKEGAPTLRILDQGPGIPEEHLERIFEPFYRPDTARSREAGGSGLGLTIARTCLEAFGATLRLENRIPHGLAAEIRFPPTG